MYSVITAAFFTILLDFDYLCCGSSEVSGLTALHSDVEDCLDFEDEETKSSHPESLKQPPTGGDSSEGDTWLDEATPDDDEDAIDDLLDGLHR